MIELGIVDDHPIVRTGLKNALAAYSDFRVVGEAGTGKDAIDLVRNTRMSMLVMDIDMPELTGIDAMRMIRAKHPDLKILIFSDYPEAQYAVTAIRHGASGYLNKSADTAELVTALRTIAARGRYTSLAVADILAQMAARGGTSETEVHDLLSEREMQVFLHLAKGSTAGMIANELSLSVKTVSTYRTRVLEKMNLKSNSDLTYYAMQHGLIR